MLGDNFGLALDPEPTLIRPHKVWHQLNALRLRNSGKPVRILRIGSLVQVKEKAARSDYRGVLDGAGCPTQSAGGAML